MISQEDISSILISTVNELGAAADGNNRVRTPSGSDGIIHSTCVLIGSLPLAVLTQRCALRSNDMYRQFSHYWSALLGANSSVSG